MVCPWFENGSVSKYMEKSGDLLSVTDRLKLVSPFSFEGHRFVLKEIASPQLIEVATGLEYCLFMLKVFISCSTDNLSQYIHLTLFMAI